VKVEECANLTESSASERVERASELIVRRLDSVVYGPRRGMDWTWTDKGEGHRRRYCVGRYPPGLRRGAFPLPPRPRGAANDRARAGGGIYSPAVRTSSRSNAADVNLPNVFMWRAAAADDGGKGESGGSGELRRGEGAGAEETIRRRRSVGRF